MSARLEAESEARRLLYTYARATDRLDRALLATIFHADAQVELGAIYKGGPDGFLDVAMGFMGQMVATRHDIGNLLIEHDGEDRMTAETYVQAWHRIDAPDGAVELVVYGRYLTRFDRRDGRWAIAWHGEVIDWGRSTPADPAWFEGNEEMGKGRRDRSDESYRLFGG